jgi:hypothetical protein
MGQPSLPGEVTTSMPMLQTLQDLSDRDAVPVVCCHLRWKLACGLPTRLHPLTLTYWLRRLAASACPNRIFDAVRVAIGQTGARWRTRWPTKTPSPN